jgi:uncharacterized protein YwqG
VRAAVGAQLAVVGATERASRLVIGLARQGHYLAGVPIWDADLDAVRQRAASLEPSDVDSALAVAIERRLVDPFSGFFLPLPPVAQDSYSAYGNWREDDDPRVGRSDWLAFDAAGRPVVHGSDTGGAFRGARHLWWWDEDGSFLEIRLLSHGPQVSRARVLDGELGHVATLRYGNEETVQRLTWRDGYAVRADVASVSPHGGWAGARTAEYDDDGMLVALREIRERGPGELVACLRLAAELTPTAVAWDARRHAPEPWPGREAALARAAPLAVSLERALRASVAEAEIDDPFLLEIFPVEHRQALYPPVGRLHGARWRDRMRRSSAQDGAALYESYKAAEAGIAVDLTVTDRLDGAALQTCRMLSTASRSGAPWSPYPDADDVAAAAGDELARRLNGEPPAGAADPFLAAVFLGDRFGTGDRFACTRRAIGEPRFARFLASLSSTKPRGGAARQLREQARRGLTDRDALEALLAQGGLPTHARRLAHEVAEPALLLVAAGDVSVRSRLGGPPLLPAGEAWPEPLTFVAAIDLAELPPSDLPADGWLLFFVDFGTGAGDGLLDEAPNEPGAAARVFWTDHAVAATGPALKPRPVVAQQLLSLPDDWTVAQLLGLDVYDRETYSELAERLRAALPASDHHHWLGGHAVGVQGAPLDRDTVLVLSMQSDGELGFSFLDGGTVQFRIPSEALARRDFARVITFGDSC